MRRMVKKDFCPRCALHCNAGYSLAREFFYYARYLSSEKFHHLIGTDMLR